MMALSRVDVGCGFFYCWLQRDKSESEELPPPVAIHATMSLAVSRLIYYVRDVALLKTFYRTHFGLDVIEEIENEWVVLQAGAVQLALHLAGIPFRRPSLSRAGTSNVKLVFSVSSDLGEMRERLLKAGVAMRGLKRYPGFPYLLCDGCDPEGNVFQLSQADDGQKADNDDNGGSAIPPMDPTLEHMQGNVS